MMQINVFVLVILGHIQWTIPGPQLESGSWLCLMDHMYFGDLNKGQLGAKQAP